MVALIRPGSLSTLSKGPGLTVDGRPGNGLMRVDGASPPNDGWGKRSRSHRTIASVSTTGQADVAPNPSSTSRNCSC